MARPYAVLYLSLACAFAAQVCHAQSKSTDSQSVIPAVIQAVEDEIYDLHHEGNYFMVDGNSGGDSKPAPINIYISREISDGVGIAVYKDMPYGEVYRYFTVDENGTVHLSGGPETFLPIGGSMLTVYMSDEDVFKFIQTAYKGSFVVDPNVSSERLKSAESRQMQRTGYSFRLKRGAGPYNHKTKE